jgi:anti-sigma factor RsiW
VLRPVDGVACAEVLDRIEALLDAEVDSGTAAAIRAHLESCAGCRAEWQRAGELRAALRALPRYEAPPRVGAALAAAAAADGPRRLRYGGSRLRPVMAAAALAAAAALVVGLAPLLRTPRPAVSDLEARAAAADARLALGVLAAVAQRTELRVRERVLDGKGIAAGLDAVSRSFRRVKKLPGAGSPQARRRGAGETIRTIPERSS